MLLLLSIVFLELITIVFGESNQNPNVIVERISPSNWNLTSKRYRLDNTKNFIDILFPRKSGCHYVDFKVHAKCHVTYDFPQSKELASAYIVRTDRTRFNLWSKTVEFSNLVSFIPIFDGYQLRTSEFNDNDAHIIIERLKGCDGDMTVYFEKFKVHTQRCVEDFLRTSETFHFVFGVLLIIGFVWMLR